MSDSPFEFPCRYPIKIFVAAGNDVLTPAREIVERHAGPIPDDCISQRASQNQNYIALTFNITAASKDQLDLLYRELTARDDVLMAL